jgi:hypothetical protein
LHVQLKEGWRREEGGGRREKAEERRENNAQCTMHNEQKSTVEWC